MAKRPFPLLLAFIIASVLAMPELSKTNNNRWILTMTNGTQDILKMSSNIPKNSIDRIERIQRLVTSLQAHSATSQKDIVQFLNQERLKGENKQYSFQPLWISNQIIISGADEGLIKSLSERSDVIKIVKDFSFHLDDPFGTTTSDFDLKSDKAAADITSWGVDNVNAPQVWAKGYNGSGIIVSTVDSGAQINHQVLANGFVGTENLGWFDPIENSVTPIDDYGHGTHVMGTIAGHFMDASGSTKIGVAPGARWMACKGCNSENYCWSSDVISCYQYLLCPHDLQGNPCDPSKAPHVINNSYFIDYMKRDGGRDDVVEAALDALEAAGIIMVVSIGNSGFCESAGYPGDYRKVIGVGSTTVDNDLSYFSSSGPGNTHGSDQIKPEIVAPGSNILSSIIGDGQQYGTKSGTSMAAPHVSGVIALLLSKNPNLNVNEIRDILFDTAGTMEMSETRNCGGIPDTQFPNFSLGYGKIDASKAIDRVPSL